MTSVSVNVRSGLYQVRAARSARGALQAARLREALDTVLFHGFPPLSSAPTPPLSNLTRENGMLIPAPPLLGRSRVSRLEHRRRKKPRAPTAGQSDRPSITAPRRSNDSHLSAGGGGASSAHRSPALSYASLMIISIIRLQGVAFLCATEQLGGGWQRGRRGGGRRRSLGRPGKGRTPSEEGRRHLRSLAASDCG